MWESIPSTAVWQVAGVYSGRRQPTELNKQYILYTILLLSEGVAASASRLRNLLTLAHFGALAPVESLTPNPSPSATTTPKTETFAKMGSPTTIEPERATLARN